MKLARYNKIYTCDLSNGEGVRVTIFFTGCSHGCEGCHNKSTWNPNSGLELTDEVIENVITECSTHTGLTLSGGDPLHRRNRATAIRICRDFKRVYPDKDIWLWTGYKLEDVQNDITMREILDYVDTIIDGKFERNNPTTKPWRGSDNQRLIHVKEIL